MDKDTNVVKKGRRIFSGESSNRQAWILGIALIALVIVMSIATNKFIQPSNIINIFVQIATLGICALGAGLVMISGGFDLTIGSMIAFSACTAAVAMANGASAPVGALIVILVGLGCGLLNGVLVVVCKSEPFIITLGMMTVYQGFTLLVTAGKNVGVSTEGFDFGREKIGGVFPVTIVVLIVVFVAIYLLFRFSKFGRRAYAIGDNEEAAYLSGVKINRNKIMIYALNGLLVGIAALLLLSRLGSGNASMGDAFLMQAIAAAVIGGVSMSGGKGSVIGIFLGTLLIGIVNNALNLLRVQSFWQNVVLGAIIILAVYVSNMGKDSR